MRVDTAGLGALEIRDAAGEPVRVAEAWRDGPALLVFLRHFG